MCENPVPCACTLEKRAAARKEHQHRRETGVMVTCPNCNGKSSAQWPGGPCTICGGTGRTTEEKAKPVLAAIARLTAQTTGTEQK